jgi:siroheme synthase
MPDDTRSGGVLVSAAGSIWRIEQPVAGWPSRAAVEAITNADVVLYDRALAPLVTALLPAGAYAEALSAVAGTAASLASMRALKLASEGWCVVQLVQPKESPRLRDGETSEVVERQDTHAPPSRIVGSPAGHASPAASVFTANGLAG